MCPSHNNLLVQKTLSLSCYFVSLLLTRLLFMLFGSSVDLARTNKRKTWNFKLVMTTRFTLSIIGYMTIDRSNLLAQKISRWASLTKQSRQDQSERGPPLLRLRQDTQLTS